MAFLYWSRPPSSLCTSLSLHSQTVLHERFMRCSSWETSITPPCAMEILYNIHVYSAVHEDARSFIFSLIGLRISQCRGSLIIMYGNTRVCVL